jgi:hypothetical protein
MVVIIWLPYLAGSTQTHRAPTCALVLAEFVDVGISEHSFRDVLATFLEEGVRCPTN